MRIRKCLKIAQLNSTPNYVINNTKLTPISVEYIPFLTSKFIKNINISSFHYSNFSNKKRMGKLYYYKLTKNSKSETKDIQLRHI